MMETILRCVSDAVILLGLVCALYGPASAQQQLTPSQTALQIDNVVNQWAQTVEACPKQIADLQKQLEAAKAPAKKPVENK
jgi:hypothetical protein